MSMLCNMYICNLYYICTFLVAMFLAKNNFMFWRILLMKYCVNRLLVTIKIKFSVSKLQKNAKNATFLQKKLQK